MSVHEDLDRAARIQPEERDHYLRLESTEWGGELSDGRWSRQDDPDLHYSRVIPVHKEIGKNKSESVGELEELILPFPSAPIYGINRKVEYGMALEQRPNMHSMRLLRRPETPPIHRLFVLYNGLNEAEDLKFYYRLADWIMRQQEQIAEDEGVACLVVPFPGHLMHSSFHGPFSETPLSRYLSDAGDLYRQFLKFMVGMRWLLSCVADSDAERWMVGGGLIAPEARVADLTGESEALYEMSAKRISRTELMAEDEDGASANLDSRSFDIGEKTGEDQMEIADRLIREALDRDSASTPDSLRVHVVGYSLGGFLAQSVFFAWPQVVSSCTTICSGGAISALSPTAFAQPEEWQSVLHALRPETINSMLQGRLGDDERDEREKPVPVDTVAGMPLKQYGYFQRIFEQVFLQEDHASYKERLSEYSLRMLFVSGGEDPIVPPANILDASPREGTTMLSVAGMTHFLNVDPKDDGDRREKEQRSFWLPEAGGMIARAAIHAEQVHMEEREAATQWRSMRKRPRRKEEGLARYSSDLLSNGYMFEEALDWVLEAVDEESGWLLLCRNVLPAAFVPTAEFTRWGTGLHHHDLRIQRYTLGLRHRASMLRKIKGRTTLIIPEQLERWFVQLSARFDPHSDAPAGRITTKKTRQGIWNRFEREWSPSLRYFEAGNIADTLAPEAINAGRFADEIGHWIGAERKYLEATHLPDVWIGVRSGSKLLAAREEREVVHGSMVEAARRVLADGRKAEKTPSGKKRAQTAKKLLEDDLEEEEIRIVQISGAEFNPRYRGQIERSPSTAKRLLVRSAVGLVRSTPVPPAERARGEALTSA